MGRSRYHICDERSPHFLTCTALNWIPLFTRPSTAAIILDALKYRQNHANWRAYGYVILENHIHLIIQAETCEKNFLASNPIPPTN
jgi:putative transposase